MLKSFTTLRRGPNCADEGADATGTTWSVGKLDSPSRSYLPVYAWFLLCFAGQQAPDGLVVGEIGSKLGIPPSTLSHHLDKLKNEALVSVRRESTFLRYTANTDAIQEVLQFLYAECCTRNNALKPESITCCK